jgi:hypothetical protein
MFSFILIDRLGETNLIRESDSTTFSRGSGESPRRALLATPLEEDLELFQKNPEKDPD